MKKLILQQSSFENLQEAFAEWLYLLGYSESAVKSLPLHLREFLYFMEQASITNLEQIEQKQIKAFFSYLSERPHDRKTTPLSAAYIAKYWQAIKNFNTFLKLTGKWAFTLPKRSIRVESSTKNILLQEEVLALYAGCDTTHLGLRDRAMLSLFYGLGLRRSEGIGLDIDDLLLSKNLVYIRKGKNYKERYVPVSAHITKDLQHYLKKSRPLLLQKATCSESDQRALLISSRGRRINDRTLSLRLRHLQEKTGDKTLLSKPLSLHSLRHAIATHLLENGMPLKSIALFLGHQSLESTQIYTHILEQEPTQLKTYAYSCRTPTARL
jgi:integrase/recombinase XerD